MSHTFVSKQSWFTAWELRASVCLLSEHPTLPHLEMWRVHLRATLGQKRAWWLSRINSFSTTRETANLSNKTLLHFLAATCNFWFLTDEFLRDQLIEKTSIPRIQEQLPMKDDRLILEKATALAIQIESAMMDSMMESALKWTILHKSACHQRSGYHPFVRLINQVLLMLKDNTWCAPLQTTCLSILSKGATSIIVTLISWGFRYHYSLMKEQKSPLWVTISTISTFHLIHSTLHDLHFKPTKIPWFGCWER